MLHKRSLLIMLVLALAMLLSVGCATPTATTGGTTSDQEFVFGVILVGPKNDRGWSQAHYEAGQYVMDNIPNTRMIVAENINAGNAETTLESVVDDMVSQGASLVFTTSDDHEEDTVTVANKYPDVTFVNISGDDAWADGKNAGVAPSNEGNIMGRMEYMKAVAGCAAAMATETGQISYLGPLINNETLRLSSSVYLGARYCYENYRNLNPDDLKFSVTWIGFWFYLPGVTLDPTEVANQFFDSGADVVVSGIDTTEAITVAGQRADAGERVFAIPYDYQGACDEAPDVCLGVPYFNWGPAYKNEIETVMAGNWQQHWDWNGPDWQNINNPDTSAVGWVDGPALTANSDWQSSVADYISKMASGEVNPWVGPINLQDGSVYLTDGEVATDYQIWYLPQLLQGMEGASN